MVSTNAFESNPISNFLLLFVFNQPLPPRTPYIAINTHPSTLNSNPSISLSISDNHKPLHRFPIQPFQSTTSIQSNKTRITKHLFIQESPTLTPSSQYCLPISHSPHSLSLHPFSDSSSFMNETNMIWCKVVKNTSNNAIDVLWSRSEKVPCSFLPVKRKLPYSKAFP